MDEHVTPASSYRIGWDLTFVHETDQCTIQAELIDI